MYWTDGQEREGSIVLTGYSINAGAKAGLAWSRGPLPPVSGSVDEFQTKEVLTYTSAPNLPPLQQIGGICHVPYMYIG